MIKKILICLLTCQNLMEGLLNEIENLSSFFLTLRIYKRWCVIELMHLTSILAYTLQLNKSENLESGPSKTKNQMHKLIYKAQHRQRALSPNITTKK